MQVERIDKEIIIRLSADQDSERLQNVLDLIRYGELTTKSNASQSDVDALSSQVNKNWWVRNKAKFIK